MFFSTWLTRIAIHEAWRRIKNRRKECEIDAAAVSLRKVSRVTHTPEDDLLTGEARTILEEAIDALPETQRTLFVMRSLEEMSVLEIANCLEITEEAVKMRLFRARLALRRLFMSARTQQVRRHSNFSVSGAIALQCVFFRESLDITRRAVKRSLMTEFFPPSSPDAQSSSSLNGSRRAASAAFAKAMTASKNSCG